MIQQRSHFFHPVVVVNPMERRKITEAVLEVYFSTSDFFISTYLDLQGSIKGDGRSITLKLQLMEAP